MKPRNILLLLTSLALAVNLAVGYRVYSSESLRPNEEAALEKINVMMRVLHLIQKDYVDPEDIDYESLIYNAMKGMVGALDPYSSFLRPDEFDDMVETTEGQFGGLGIVVTVRNGRLTVVAPIEGTPGSRAGILAGDQIIEINGQEVTDAKLSEAVQKLKGEPGTSVSLTIYRPDTEETKELTVERAVIEVPSVKGTQIVAETIGYVRIVQFDEGTTGKLEAALATLNKEGAKALILDLRNNPGGLLTSAVDVCSQFLKPDKLVVFTEGRQPSQRQEYLTDNGPKFLNPPVVCLVNHGSASAAEIVAGCLQDYKRAVLVGTPTFGKGSVQNVIRLPDGSALRLTTAMYYTPSKRVIHEQGIEPNIVVKLSNEQAKALVERQMAVGSSAELDPAADPQLQRAIETLQSYEVFQKASKPQ
ncbi:MAG: S41 family peptidase [Candidatus Pacebacteria bacterium]|nr:S41 family peptidase [Candidatus Paceibacterota bacterium]